MEMCDKMQEKIQIRAQRSAFLEKLTKGYKDTSNVSTEEMIKFKLTDSQRRLWYLYQLSPEAACAYDIFFAFSFDNKIDPFLLEEALNSLFLRHDSLRIKINVSDGEPWQEVMPRSEKFPFEFIDLSQFDYHRQKK